MTKEQEQKRIQELTDRFLEQECEGEFLGSCMFRFRIAGDYARCELTETTFRKLSEMTLEILPELSRLCQEHRISQEMMFGFYQMVPANSKVDYFGSQCEVIVNQPGGIFFSQTIESWLLAVEEKWRMKKPEENGLWYPLMCRLCTAVFWVTMTAYSDLEDLERAYGAYEYLMKTALRELGSEISEAEYREPAVRFYGNKKKRRHSRNTRKSKKTPA